jgi:hypothetical protein
LSRRINQWFRQQICHCWDRSLRFGRQGQHIRCKRHSIISNRRGQERAKRTQHAPPHNGSSQHRLASKQELDDSLPTL